jgi:hypothetical protein
MIRNKIAEFHSMTNKIMLQNFPANLQQTTPLTMLHTSRSFANTHAHMLPQACELETGVLHKYTKISFQIILVIP